LVQSCDRRCVRRRCKAQSASLDAFAHFRQFRRRNHVNSNEIVHGQITVARQPDGLLFGADRRDREHDRIACNYIERRCGHLLLARRREQGAKVKVVLHSLDKAGHNQIAVALKPAGHPGVAHLAVGAKHKDAIGEV
jgi:hypothetical protein